MSNPQKRNWTAQIVIAFKNKALNVYGRALEDEMRHVLARVDDPRDVAAYIENMAMASVLWAQAKGMGSGDKERYGKCP